MLYSRFPRATSVMQNASNPIVRKPSARRFTRCSRRLLPSPPRLHTAGTVYLGLVGGNRVLRYNNCDVPRPGVVFAECRRLVFETAHFYALLPVSVRNYRRCVIECVRISSGRLVDEFFRHPYTKRSVV